MSVQSASYVDNYVCSFPRDSYEGIYEFFVDRDSDVFDASEITQQVPTYIEGDLRMMVGTATETLLSRLQTII